MCILPHRIRFKNSCPLNSTFTFKSYIQSSHNSMSCAVCFLSVCYGHRVSLQNGFYQRVRGNLEIEAFCNDGFELNGDNRRFCDNDLQSYTGSDPSCDGKFCTLNPRCCKLMYSIPIFHSITALLGAIAVFSVRVVYGTVIDRYF